MECKNIIDFRLNRSLWLAAQESRESRNGTEILERLRLYGIGTDFIFQEKCSSIVLLWYLWVYHRKMPNEELV